MDIITRPACPRFDLAKPSFYEEIGNFLCLSRSFRDFHRLPSSKFKLHRHSRTNVYSIASEQRREVESSNDIIESRSRRNQSMRVGDMSEEFNKMRAQMEEDEKLASLIRGLRGQNLSNSLLAVDDVHLHLVEVSGSGDASTPFGGNFRVVG